MLENKVLCKLADKIKDVPVSKMRQLLQDYDNAPLWFIMDVDDALLPLLEKSLAEAITSPYDTIRVRATILAKDLEWNLQLYKARNLL